jgi:hypothetical protein
MCFHSLLVIPLSDQGQEEAAICVFWINDGIDKCLVGFLPRHNIQHRHDFDGKVAQVVELLQLSPSPAVRARSQRLCGACMAALCIESHRVHP